MAAGRCCSALGGRPGRWGAAVGDAVVAAAMVAPWPVGAVLPGAAAIGSSQLSIMVLWVGVVKEDVNRGIEEG